MAEKCEECGVRDVSGFKGYSKYGLCHACGLEQARARKESGKLTEWQEKIKLKNLRAKMRRDEAMEEATNEKWEREKIAQGVLRKKPAKDDFSFMPPYMRWVALNPAVTITAEEMTHEDRAKEQLFIQRMGKPSRLSENIYRMVKGDQKALERIFDKVGSMYASHQKKRESEDKLGDVKMVDDIWAMLDECIKPDGVVGKARKGGKLKARLENMK